MVRKPAPQPLALAESALPASDRRLPETLKIVSPDDHFAAKRSPTSPASLKLQAVQAVHSAQSLPPSLHSVPQSPSPSQSQPLPLPQSQPHQSQSQQSQRFPQPLHVADLVQQPPDDIDSPAFPPYQQQQQQQQQEQQQQQFTQQQEQPPQPQQPQRQQTQNPNRPPVSFQQKHGHGRRQAEEKASKSNFRFHFGKSSTAKSSEKTASSTSSSQGQGQSGTGVLSKTNTHTNTGPPGSRAGRFDKSQNEEAYPVPPRTAGGPGDRPPPSRSDASFTGDTDSVSVKKGKSKTFPRLGRTRSIRDEPNPLSSNLNSLNVSAATTPTNIAVSASSPGLEMKMRAAEPDRVHQATHTPQNHQNQHQQPAALKTAPLAQHDRSFRDMMSSSNRNQSADRAVTRENRSERDHHHFRSNRNQDNNNGTGGGSFFNGLKNSSRSAADIISKGLFGKNGRGGGSGGTNGNERSSEPVVDDEHYVLKVINQPLVEQTRLTRISKRLEDSRDRTEFWMPAFPWRAIDYLNYKGTDVEGLYRVPGSGPQIKKWQRRFDEEYDVNLFEQEDLYDINIIGSMLKAWLRELPDELFPKEAQERIARECAGAEKVPQMLVDELSSLSPFNYYLLFAITCHLSLLLAHSDKNKMDFRNLCICFQPCMKIDAFSFKFLVCDWRDCWKGCLNETQFMRDEYALFSAPLPRSMGGADAEDDQEGTRQDAGDVTTPDDGISSTDSRSEKRPDQQRSDARSDPRSDRPETRHDRQARAPRTETSDETLSTTLTSLTIDSSTRVTTPPRLAHSGDLRPLSPIKPLSPMGF
ncbi:hypothetical protein F503_04744 [Ophiostoma piceae UAMH 11346]|uniref:Rho-GAP domain-containing protein n=1 Tax=Ophiostoma piceae (strain UAMH 11346) TaxID=1262450 RepID=S3BSK3_OPHP1|nr:hypothetical protein F503_04744 [Ophiostoma piceae UAMH 11346]